MAYRIQFFRAGEVVHSMPWLETKRETIDSAKRLMAHYNADFVRVIDMDGSGGEVWSERKDPLNF